MGKSVITRETSLRLWPLDYVVVYGETSWGTLFAASVNSENLDITPGSLKVSDTESDGIYKKKITFRTPLTDKSREIMLAALKENRLVAMYSDERGVDRLVGSPKWPATLTWVSNGGSAEVTLTATGNSPNRRAIPYVATGLSLT